MGVDRWSQGSSVNGTQGGAYRNSYHRGNYRGDGNFGGYGNGNFGHGGTHYDNGSYDTSKVDRASSEHMTAIGQKNGAATKYGSNSAGDTIENASSSAAALEEKINTAQSEMSQALQEATSKENEKFDLIFSILMELQTRQSKLEESLKFLKAQYEPNGGQPQMMAEAVPMPSGQGDSLQGGSPHGGSMTSSMGSPQAGMMGMAGAQMPMNQQCGNMVMMDSSGNCIVPVVVPQNGGQMQFTQMMMPQGATMQVMPQQQVQFAANGGQGAEGCGGFQQWNGGMQTNMGDASSTTAGGQHSSSSAGSGSGSGPGTARSTGEQNGSLESCSKSVDPSS